MTPHPAPGSSRLSAAVPALLAVALITWPGVTTHADDPDAMPPNVVWIIADDLGWGELSCQNPDTDVPTPQLDRIAESGARFTQAYVTAPFCAASRAGMLTGRYQTRFGFELNPIGPVNDEPGVGLPRSESTIATLLRQQSGYATGLVGKWHLGATSPFHPHRHGFDEFFGFTHEGHYYVPPPWDGMVTWLRRRSLPGGGEGLWRSQDGRRFETTHMGHEEPAYDAFNPILRGSQPVHEPDYLTDAFTREAVDFIGRHRERPFFLVVAHLAVHSPMQAPVADVQRFEHIQDPQRRIFAAMLYRLDLGVGRILDALAEHGVERRTIVVFMSDNGAPTRELTSSNGLLRGEKGGVYDGGLRVPMLVRWPDVIEPGQVIHQPVISLDLGATFLAAAGAEPPQPLDGTDLRDLLDAGPVERTFFWRIGPERRALRRGDWKLVSHRQEAWELFHLGDDPGEQHDRAAEFPERVQTLERTWLDLADEMADPLW